ncbi:hypothetical protein LCGC14_0207780 [marine sediment metagenome]|uniref:Uncharacterized protein n=1 Tax=marine sediment metagenome TaxID=412755 RepID=A0A0F9UXS4_9ZZZZ
MDNDTLAAKIKQLKAEVAKQNLAALECDMDDAIVLAYRAGILACHPNFHWNDLEIQ